MQSVRCTATEWLKGRLSERQILLFKFVKYHRTLPRLRYPVTFSEKIQNRKLYDADPRFSEFADKVRAKEHVRTVIGAHFVIPSLWTGKRLPPVEARSWPIPFVIKASHGSSWNKFVRSEADRDWAYIDQVCEQWLNSRFLPERWYIKIEPQILVEPLLGDAQGSLIDYKFFVFGGRAEFVQVDTNQETDQKIFFYDRNWRRQPFWVWRRQPFWLNDYPRETREIERPRHFTEMLEAAEKLGSEFNFVRVDLYDLDSGPKFGELTFAPASGFERFHPIKYDRMLGSFWDLPPVPVSGIGLCSRIRNSSLISRSLVRIRSRRDFPPDLEVASSRFLSDQNKTEEHEGLPLAKPAPLAVLAANRPNSIKAGRVRMSLRTSTSTMSSTSGPSVGDDTKPQAT